MEQQLDVAEVGKMEDKMAPPQEMYSQVREQFWKLNVNDYAEREQKK